jgi:UDP-N-acetylmuramoylalanine--D-glutamate ligase
MAGNGGGDALLDYLDRMRAGGDQYAQTALGMRQAMELAGKRVLVIGLGVSGRAAARLAAARGAQLVLADARADIAREGLPAGELRLGAEDPARLDGVDLAIASPGVPPTSPLMRAAVAAGIPLIGELEFGARFVRAPIVAITGTNGKSTVTMMIGAMLRAAGLRAFVGGNLGTPIAEAATGDFDAAVVEASSYQLELVERFHPRVAVHLNLSDDHLDRYRDFAEYGRAKARIFENQDAADCAVLNRDDPNVWRLAASARARVFSFGLQAPPPSGDAIWPVRDALAWRFRGAEGEIDLRRFTLRGRHNLANAMAAAAAALAMGAGAAAIESALADFKGLKHRIEFVAEKRGVRYVDDSKGTNVGAAVEALYAVEPPVILIAGGVDKGGDYAPLRAAVRERARLVILNGAAREKMRAALAGAAAIEAAPTMDEAVRIAARRACPGDTVLLSPACSSFDQFKDYAERGRVFQELVRTL